MHCFGNFLLHHISVSDDRKISDFGSLGSAELRAQAHSTFFQRCAVSCACCISLIFAHYAFRGSIGASSGLVTPSLDGRLRIAILPRAVTEDRRRSLLSSSFHFSLRKCTVKLFFSFGFPTCTCIPGKRTTMVNARRRTPLINVPCLEFMS